MSHGIILIVRRPFELLGLLAFKIPAQVNFFMNYVVANSVVYYTYALWRPFSLLATAWAQCRARSRRDVNNAFTRSPFDYAYFYGFHVLMFLIVLTYRCAPSLHLSVRVMLDALVLAARLRR